LNEFFPEKNPLPFAELKKTSRRFKVPAGSKVCQTSVKLHTLGNEDYFMVSRMNHQYRLLVTQDLRFEFCHRFVISDPHLQNHSLHHRRSHLDYYLLQNAC
tara:strand:+ start:6679 stop:6981 length:303 start_codon:yes stop_codon:yes gene_type:complete